MAFYAARKIPPSGEGSIEALERACNMDLKRLSELEASERGTLTRIDAPEGMLALMEMGCTVGEDIEVRHIAPLGDPMACLLVAMWWRCGESRPIRCG